MFLLQQPQQQQMSDAVDHSRLLKTFIAGTAP